jgi:predicted transcriptional regulator
MKGLGTGSSSRLPECEIRFLTFLTLVSQLLTMNRITIRLPNELRADLQGLSQEQNKPVSDIVRESIQRYVAVEKFRALHKKTLPFAEAQGFLTDDDVFRAIS